MTCGPLGPNVQSKCSLPAWHPTWISRLLKETSDDPSSDPSLHAVGPGILDCDAQQRGPPCAARNGTAGQLRTPLPTAGQAGLPAASVGERRAGGLAPRLGRGGPRGHHRAPRRVPLRLSRRLEGPGGQRQRPGPRRHRLAAGTVLVLARRRVAAGLCPARRGPDQEDPRPARPHRRRREQGRFRHHVHLLEERLQARGLQQLGPFPDGPRPGGALQRHRR